MSQEYYQTLHQQYPFLSAENLDLLQRQSTIVKLDKKAYWQEGNYKDKVAFIVSGAIRAFFIDEEGKEKTTIIRPAKKTIVAPGATKLLEHKTYYLQAITDTVLIEIRLSSLLGLCQEHPQVFQFFFFNIADHLNAMLERVENLISLKPEERVQYLINHKKELLASIPQKYLADYIGITPVSLSRLLKKINGD